MTSLSRYPSGLDLDMVIQGVISSIGLFLLGVPHALNPDTESG